MKYEVFLKADGIEMEYKTDKREAWEYLFHLLLTRADDMLRVISKEHLHTK